MFTRTNISLSFTKSQWFSFSTGFKKKKKNGKKKHFQLDYMLKTHKGQCRLFLRQTGLMLGVT